MRKLLYLICSYLNKQANTKQHWVLSGWGENGEWQHRSTEPWPEAVSGVRRPSIVNSFQSWHRRAWQSVLTYGVGSGRTEYSWQRLLGICPFRWWVNIPAYHTEPFCHLHKTVVWRDGQALILSHTDVYACVNSELHDLGPLQCMCP